MITIFVLGEIFISVLAILFLLFLLSSSYTPCFHAVLVRIWGEHYYYYGTVSCLARSHKSQHWQINFFIHSFAVFEFQVINILLFSIHRDCFLSFFFSLRIYILILFILFLLHCSTRNNKWKFLLRELKSNDLLDTFIFRYTPIRHNNFYTQSFLFFESTQFQLNLLTIRMHDGAIKMFRSTL